ncbi:MAG: hypothetical protein RR696_03760 [Clostridia bacterium]
MNGLCVGLCVALLMCFSETAMQSAQAAAMVFAQSVMPALFPMMVLCGLLLPKQQRNPARLRQGQFWGLLFFSFAAGSPASAKRVRQLSQAGLVQREQMLPLLALTGVMSPMFFVGTLSGWTGLPTAAWTMLGLHWASALLAGGGCFLYQRFKNNAKGLRAAPQAEGAEKITNANATENSVMSALPAAITSAAQALLAVCGAMMVFAIVVGVLRAALAAVLPQWTAAHGPFLAVLHALLEIGGGAAELLSSFEAPPLPLLCGLCSFGGLSIWLQNLLFVGECVRPAKLLLLRALHGALAYGLCRLFLGCFPMLAQAFMPMVGHMEALPVIRADISPLLPLLLLLLTALAARFPRPSASS